MIMNMKSFLMWYVWSSWRHYTLPRRIKMRRHINDYPRRGVGLDTQYKMTSTDRYVPGDIVFHWRRDCLTMCMSSNRYAWPSPVPCVIHVLMFRGDRDDDVANCEFLWSCRVDDFIGKSIPCLRLVIYVRKDLTKSDVLWSEMTSIAIMAPTLWWDCMDGRRWLDVVREPAWKLDAALN